MLYPHFAEAERLGIGMATRARAAHPQRPIACLGAGVQGDRAAAGHHRCGHVARVVHKPADGAPWRSAPLPEPSSAAARALSFHTLAWTLPSQTLAHTPIRPLVGYLRHPEAARRRRQLLGRAAKQGLPHPGLAPGGVARHRLGAADTYRPRRASTYMQGLERSATSGLSGGSARAASTRHIYAWEAKFHLDAGNTGDAAAIVDRTSCNRHVGAQQGKHNRWRTLRAVATPRVCGGQIGSATPRRRGAARGAAA